MSIITLVSPCLRPPIKTNVSIITLVSPCLRPPINVQRINHHTGLTLSQTTHQDQCVNHHTGLTLSQTSIAGGPAQLSFVAVKSLVTVVLTSCCLSSVTDRRNISALSTTDQTLWSRIVDAPSPLATPTSDSIYGT